jgi:hypothetical protein
MSLKLTLFGSRFFNERPLCAEAIQQWISFLPKPYQRAEPAAALPRRTI